MSAGDSTPYRGSSPVQVNHSLKRYFERETEDNLQFLSRMQADMDLMSADGWRVQSVSFRWPYTGEQAAIVLYTRPTG